MIRRGYPSDLKPMEWTAIQPFFSRQKKRGRKIRTNKRDIVNAIFYMLKTGCQWSHLPNDFPSPKTVFHYYNTWIKNGLWEKINRKLSERIRIEAGRESTPSAVIIDSQTVKSTSSSKDSGYDGGKKIKGDKRHIMVDVMGLLIAVIVTSANVGDRVGAIENFFNTSDQLPRVEKIWADGSYTGPFIEFTKLTFDWEVEIIKPNKDKPGFNIRPWSWIVERTFAWLNHTRRLSKNYEKRKSTSESLIQASMVRLMLRRMVP